MTERVAFERGKHGLKATRKFLRSGVVGARDEALSDEKVAKLSDDDVDRLRDLGLVELTDGRGVVSGGDAETAATAPSTETAATTTEAKAPAAKAPAAK